VSTAVPTAERDLTEVRAMITEVFGDRTRLAELYADLLCTAGIERGMLGPREADRVWQRHVLNSAALARLIPANLRVVDLGSGAGLPGIPIAIARPDLSVVLLEPMQRRVSFLNDCLGRLALPNVCVHRGRAETGLPGGPADVVVVRAVGSLDKLLRLSFPLLVPGGVMLALKGSSAAGEVEQVNRDGAPRAELLSVPAAGQAATVVRAARPGAAAIATTSARAGSAG
jgi:16S rRNA (guanine527-N7)-methyltransferase